MLLFSTDKHFLEFATVLRYFDVHNSCFALIKNMLLVEIR